MILTCPCHILLPLLEVTPPVSLPAGLQGEGCGLLSWDLLMFSPQHNVPPPAVGTDPQVWVLSHLQTRDWPRWPIRHWMPNTDLRVTSEKRGRRKCATMFLAFKSYQKHSHTRYCSTVNLSVWVGVPVLLHVIMVGSGSSVWAQGDFNQLYPLTLWTVGFTHLIRVSQAISWLSFICTETGRKTQERGKKGKGGGRGQETEAGAQGLKNWCKNEDCSVGKKGEKNIWLVHMSLCNLPMQFPYLGRCHIPALCSTTSPRSVSEMLLM